MLTLDQSLTNRLKHVGASVKLLTSNILISNSIEIITVITVPGLAEDGISEVMLSQKVETVLHSDLHVHPDDGVSYILPTAPEKHSAMMY